MGLKEYFKPKAAPKPDEAPAAHGPVEQTTQQPVPSPSSAGSIFSDDSLTSKDSRFINDIKYDVVVNYIFQKQCRSMWIEDLSGAKEGVLIRQRGGDYLACPGTLADSELAKNMAALRVQAAITMRSRVISTFLLHTPDIAEIPISAGLRVQVLPTIADLKRARKHQYAAFIQSDSLLVVWDDDTTNLLHRAEALESDMLKLVWHSARGGEEGEKKGEAIATESEIDPETGLIATEKRPAVFYHAFLVGVALCLLFTILIGLAYREVVLEILYAGSYTSLAFLAVTPILAFFCLFFVMVIVSIIAQILGPISYLRQNSKYYSATVSPRLRDSHLPHVTVQAPVYKEGLESVITPTMTSIKKAISTYELQGGTANILVHDDGMQVIDEEERQARRDYYSSNSIGWTSRPKHGDNGYVRKGKFKKASNMNHGLSLSNLVEERLQAVERRAGWTADDETQAYEACLQEVLKESGGRDWAEGDIRIGDYILLIDSDTRVPSDCLLDAVSELERCPDVAILQFTSGVMQVAHDFFENGITFFTNMIYTAIRFGVAAGDVAPFVGHNAILRWSAVQKVAFIDADGDERFWAETTVSEDFDMALRLQIEGYIVRLAAWAGTGFKEGVSLTVYDELTRWEKYAYGCNELVFQPFRYWFTRGPFTPLLRRFIASNMPIGSKMSILAYIGTYYAIASSWIFTTVNYVAVGLYNGYLDKWYVQSWEIWISVLVVFAAAGNVALAVQRYRLGEQSFFGGLFTNMCWALMFVVFFGGLSLHLSQAILCHFFSINMEWGATAKEVENTNFFREVPKVLKKFKYTFIVSTLGIVAVIIMALGTSFIPWSYTITDFVAIFPFVALCAFHILFPIILNPGLTKFSW